MKYIITLAVLLVVAITSDLSAQYRGFENISYSVEADGSVTIKYDFDENPDETFLVEAFLKDENVSAFSLKVDNAQGDIGKGKYAGKSRKIKWNIVKDFSGELDSSSFYFELHATKVKSNYSWYYYAGAAAAGVVAAVFLTSKKQETPASRTELIDPPVRP